MGNSHRRATISKFSVARWGCPARCADLSWLQLGATAFVLCRRELLSIGRRPFKNGFYRALELWFVRVTLEQFRISNLDEPP